jgi:hypothetical protein
MVPALLVWLRVIRDADTGGRLSPDAATRRVFLLEAGHSTLMGFAVGYSL